MIATAPAGWAAGPLAAGLFALTYFGLALGRLPGLRIDRAGVAVVGAAAMLATGVLDLKAAAGAVDADTIVLLFAMMILAGYLRLAGFFDRATGWLAARGPGPHALLALVIGLSGVLSAFLVNDVVCVALTPAILDLCRRLGRPPVPYLVGLATAANIGSAATITGNPQNIIIGSLSHVSYAHFAARLAPAALVGLAIDYAVIALVYRRALGRPAEARARSEARPRSVRRAMLAKGLAVTLGAVALFFAGAPITVVALGAAGVLLLDRIRPEKVYRAIDWPLLAMFAGLFVVVHAFEVHVIWPRGLERMPALARSPVGLLSAASLVLSNLVSNVPAVLLFRPAIETIPAQEAAWLALALSSTFAGNLTLLGSVANLIVAETARRSGAELTFGEYLKVGVPVTLLTTLVGAGWLAWLYHLT